MLLDQYNRFFDHRLGIEFLFLNSCEKEDHNNHFGYIDTDKLVNTILSNNQGTENYTKICICHHRIELDPRIPKSILDNSYEVETILLKNGYNIVFTGHIHENRVCEKRDSGKSIIYSGAGSAGVESSQRMDGDSKSVYYSCIRFL